MASININGSWTGSSKNLCSLVLQVSSVSNIDTNSSTVSYSLLAYRNSAYLGTYNAYTSISVSIDGQVDSATINFDIRKISVGSAFLIRSGSFNVAHNNDGTKTIACSASVNLNGTSLGMGTASGNFTLDTIPRYVNTNLWNTGEYLNHATFQYSADAPCDDVYIHVRTTTNPEKWIYNQSIGTQNPFTVSGLSPGTRYKIRIDARRTGTNLYKLSNDITFTTKAIATITNSIDFTLGNNIPLRLSNPSGASISLYLKVGSTTIWSSTIGNVSSYTIALNSTQVSNMSKLIPNGSSSTYSIEVKITSNGSTYSSTKQGTYYINKSTEAPTVSASSISYSDINNVANGNIIQSKSSLRVIIAGGSGTGKNGATIKTWTVNFNGVTKSSNYSGSAVNFDFGIPSTSGTFNISFTVTDSRGLTSSAAIKPITIHPYRNPSLSVSLSRVNGYEANVTLAINARVVTSSGFSNSIKTCSCVRSDNVTKNISGAIGKTSYNTSLNNFDTPAIEKSYNYTFTLTDQLNTKATVVVFVGEGRPALIIAENGTVGIGSYVDDGYKCQIGGNLRVDGDIYINSNTIKKHAWNNPVDSTTSTDTTLSLAASVGKTLGDKINTVDGKFSKYLSLTGGTITGSLKVNTDINVGKKLNTSVEGIYINSNGRIWSPSNQKLYLRASNESNYFLYLGVSENRWALTPNVNRMLELGSPNYQWNNIHTAATTSSNYYWGNGWLMSDVNTGAKAVSFGYGAAMNKYATSIYGNIVNLVPFDTNGNAGHVMQAIKEKSGNQRTIFKPESNGNAYLGTISYRWNTAFFTNNITQSDKKTKNNIILLDDNKTKEFIMSLSPSSYTLKNSDSNNPRIHMGLIAQDVAEVAKKVNMGDLSLYQASYIDENSDDEQPYFEGADESKLSWGLNYNELIAPIIKVLQLHEQEIKKLKENK